jgi:hypothetical protein
MNLATILVCFLGLGAPASGASDQSAPTQATPAQGTASLPAPASTSGQTQTAGKPKAKVPHSHLRKRVKVPDCSTPPPGGTDGKALATSNSSSGGAKPCPPPKVVVKNGGSAEPTEELKGDTSPDKASYERSTTEQLSAGTEENLKKIAELEMTASQQEMVSQVKQFMEQSKAAVAGGDLERGHNLALKAHLLSEELIKP